jgi:hypothetical protein
MPIGVVGQPNAGIPNRVAAAEKVSRIGVAAMYAAILICNPYVLGRRLTSRSLTSFMQ